MSELLQVVVVGLSLPDCEKEKILDFVTKEIEHYKDKSVYTRQDRSYALRAITLAVIRVGTDYSNKELKREFFNATTLYEFMWMANWQYL